MTFTKEQLIKRIEKQNDINATIIERLSDDSAAVSRLAVEAATMDMKILDIALSALTASERPPKDCGVKGVAMDASYRRQGARTGWADCLASILGEID
ncbi:hypothetical protein H3N91_003294 [Salmonella enterica]|nr:hypothetical protein [Salmonella enterica]EEA2271184.1 hypothetical protein [Salmonella enterica]EFV5117786.1 hypothetical protein [Salmonella enterica]EGB7058997.1 hypothetical protein [Salmonella enterica]EKL9524202.1 hypothetical protein [Salmonella enterica]